MSKKSRIRRSFNKGHGKRPQTLLKSESQLLYHNSWWLWRQLTWKKSALVMCKILGLFVNTLTADDKNSLVNRDNFNAIDSDAIVSEIKKLFLLLFCIFWIKINLWTFWKKKMTLIVYVFQKLETAKDLVRQMSKKSRFGRPFSKGDGKGSQTLMKSEG